MKFGFKKYRGLPYFWPLFFFNFRTIYNFILSRMSIRCLSANGFVSRINIRYLCVTSKLSNFDEQKRQQMRASLQAGFFSIFFYLKSRDLKNKFWMNLNRNLNAKGEYLKVSAWKKNRKKKKLNSERPTKVWQKGHFIPYCFRIN